MFEQFGKRSISFLLALVMIFTMVPVQAFATGDVHDHTVEDHGELQAIRVTALPDKVEYVQGEELDVSGGKILLDYGSDHGHEMEMTLDMVSGYEPAVTGVQTLTVTCEGLTDTFRVTVSAAAAQASDLEEPEETVKDGWVWENRTWYYYEQGVPRAGWFCYHGSDYYLKEDGSVTTGWVQINGKYRYFSRTGSMRTGWIETEAGKLYLMSNGAPAIGERVIDGVRYRFDENGILI